MNVNIHIIHTLCHSFSDDPLLLTSTNTANEISPKIVKRGKRITTYGVALDLVKQVAESRQLAQSHKSCVLEKR
jgi:hypothetical protein